MRKSSTIILIVILCIMIFLIGSICGFFVSNNLKTEPPNDLVESQSDIIEPQNDITGTYKSNTWRKTGAVLVLYEDGTCICPTGIYDAKGTWSVDGKTVHLLVVLSDGETIEEYDATIVPNGIILKGFFFEKI